MFSRSRERTTLLSLRKTLSAIHFQFCRLLKQYVLLFVLDFELADKDVLRELGVFVDGRAQGLPPPKKTNPQNKRFDAQETCTELCGRMDV